MNGKDAETTMRTNRDQPRLVDVLAGIEEITMDDCVFKAIIQIEMQKISLFVQDKRGNNYSGLVDIDVSGIDNILDKRLYAPLVSICEDYISEREDISVRQSIDSGKKVVARFFNAIGINKNIFKKNDNSGKYHFTPELSELILQILSSKYQDTSRGSDSKNTTTSLIINEHWEDISVVDANVFSGLLIDAISQSLASSEEKSQAQDAVRCFYNKPAKNAFRGFGIPKNDLVEATLFFTWLEIMEIGWRPKPYEYRKPAHDAMWRRIEEKVYRDLLNEEALEVVNRDEPLTFGPWTYEVHCIQNPNFRSVKLFFKENRLFREK